MWKKIEIYGKTITSNELHLKNTLLSGQCFNFKFIDTKGFYLGTVLNNILLLRENNKIIEYQFLIKDPFINNELEFLKEYFQFDFNLEKEIVNSKDLNINNELIEVLKKFSGLRLIKQQIFECTISFICSANNNISRITKMIDSLKLKYGKKLYHDAEIGQYHAFPDFNSLKTITVQEMNEMGFGYRSKYIRGTIDLLEEKGVNWLDQVVSSENPSEELMKLPGVGRKVADCISLFSCGKFNIVPIDVHMFNFYNENLSNFTGEKYKKIDSVSNKNNYLLLQSNMQKILGPYAGWVHSMFFMNRISSKKQVNTIGKGKRINTDLEDKISEKGTKKKKTD